MIGPSAFSRLRGAAGIVLLAGLLAAAPLPASAESRTICTIVTDLDTGRTILREGDCATRRSPASTFKVALAVIGFDTGFLTDPHAPVLTIRKGEADWGGAAWRRPTDPTAWLKYSVVWYSQRIAAALGAARIEAYLRKFDYGNADMAGDPGKDNGLLRAWISSSLRISPEEEVRFIARLATGRLPVGPAAIQSTVRSMDGSESGGWQVKGKTGSFYPRKQDGGFDRNHAWGWFVGWAEKDGRRVAFARLNQDRMRDPRPAGLRARDGFLRDLPRLLD